MRKNTIIAVVLVVAIAAGAWYWWSTQNNAAPAAAPSGPSGAAGTNGSPNQGNMGQPDNGTPQTPQASTILGIQSSAALGQYLVAANNMTLYTYAKDKPGVSNCSGTCAANWPPYTVASASALGLPTEITGAVATITRADGSLQVTYKGAPLYFWKGDAKPGDTTGQGVGGIWFVAKP